MNDSASCYGCAEDILIEPMVVPKLKLRHVERKVFFANLMKCPNYTTLKIDQKPSMVLVCTAPTTYCPCA